MRMIADTPAFVTHNIASPGFDDLRWLMPVRPGDVLTGRAAVLEARRSISKPDRGLVRFLQSLKNQNGETVLDLKSLVFYWRRETTVLDDLHAAGGGD